MNLFAFLSVFVGVFSWLLVMAFMDGLQQQSRNHMLNENPHIIWEGSVRSDLQEKLPLIREKLGTKLKSLDLILQTEGLLERVAEAGEDRDIEAVIMQGDSKLTKGQAMVGEELATTAGIKHGDLLELRSIWKLEENALAVRLSGFYKSQVFDIDKRVVRVNQRDLEEWLGMPGAASRLAIQIENPDEASSLVPLLSAITGVEMKTWQEIDASYWYSLKLERFAMALSMFFVIALASLSINMAISARVAERSREISLLRALGVTQNQVFYLYLLQGLIIGLISIASALILAPLVGGFISRNFQLPDVYYRTDLPLYWDIPSVILLTLVCLLLCVWASWKPAKRGMQTAVAVGLRF